MAYSIGEVEELTGVKAHVLRYWESVIPASAPQKNVGGRRVYTEREIEMILRIKYLIEEKKFTIEGARNQLIKESEIAVNNADLLDDIHDLRNNLSDIYLTMKKNRTKNSDAEQAE